METNEQKWPGCVESGVIVAELKFATSEWRTDRWLWKGMWDDWGDWEQLDSALLSGSATQLRLAAPDMISHGGSHLHWWNVLEERLQSTTDSQKMGDSDTCHDPVYIAGPNQHKLKVSLIHNPSVKRCIVVALTQHRHKPKSVWLKLDLSDSAQAISVPSLSFRPDWLHSMTLVPVTDLPWWVTGVGSSTLTDRFKHSSSRNKLGFYLLPISPELIWWNLAIDQIQLRGTKLL